MTTVRTWVNRKTGKRTQKVTIRIEHDLSLEDMVNGLCSEHARHKAPEKELPDSMTLKEIMECVRNEYRYRGENTVWTWSDGLYGSEDEQARQWARRLILAVLPELEEE